MIENIACQEFGPIGTRKICPLIYGRHRQCDGWKDLDKEGRHYMDYFINAVSNTITNFKSETRDFQGFENEIFLDLEKELPADLLNRFDVVFNHTVLEYIYNVYAAFRNLCLMTKDIVVLVVPF